MNERVARLDRLFAIIHAPSEKTAGLTLDEMVERPGVNRRTAGMLWDIILCRCDLDEAVDNHRKRFATRDRLRRY